MGAWLATAGALALSDQPAFILLPILTVLGFVGGGVWIRRRQGREASKAIRVSGNSRRKLVVGISGERHCFGWWKHLCSWRGDGKDLDIYARRIHRT